MTNQHKINLLKARILFRISGSIKKGVFIGDKVVGKMYKKTKRAFKLNHIQSKMFNCNYITSSIHK